MRVIEVGPLDHDWPQWAKSVRRTITWRWQFRHSKQLMLFLFVSSYHRPVRGSGRVGPAALRDQDRRYPHDSASSGELPRHRQEAGGNAWPGCAQGT